MKDKEGPSTETAENRSPLGIALDVIDDEEQRRTRIAWLYYIEGRTQAEIGHLLGISRARVVRDLQLARETGLVQIRIDGRLAPCVAHERKLTEAYGLRDCLVLPTPVDEEHLPATLGMALGHWLSDHMRPGQTLGIGWGRTLYWSVRALRRQKIEDLTVVSLLGGVGRGLEINTYETASRLAEKLGAQCYYLAAPTFASSARMRDMLIHQRPIAEVLERARSADLAIASVGELSPRATNRRLGLIQAEEQRALGELGATGDLLGTFLDAEGRPVDHPINRRVVGLPLADFRRLPVRVLASGGDRKVPAVRAVLRGGYVNVLITDIRTAAAVL